MSKNLICDHSELQDMGKSLKNRNKILNSFKHKIQSKTCPYKLSYNNIILKIHGNKRPVFYRKQKAEYKPERLKYFTYTYIQNIYTILDNIKIKNFTICMEIQKSSNSQSNLEKEEWNWRNQLA